MGETWHGQEGRSTHMYQGHVLGLPSQIELDLSRINPHLTCTLCNGYLCEPYTIKECVHSFCKTCIYKYVSINPKCPVCGIRLSSQPHEWMSHDRTLQALIFKFFPELSSFIDSSEADYLRENNLAPRAVPSELRLDEGINLNSAGAVEDQFRFRLKEVDAQPGLQLEFVFTTARDARIG